MGRGCKIDKSVVARWAYIMELATVNTKGDENKGFIGLCIGVLCQGIKGKSVCKARDKRKMGEL